MAQSNDMDLQDVSPKMFELQSKESLIQPTPVNNFDLSNTQTSIKKDTNLVVDGSTTTIQGDITSSTTSVNSNTDTEVAGAISSINSNTTTQTGVVNTNVNTLKETPISAAVSLASTTSFTTILNYNGQGTVQQLNGYLQTNTSSGVAGLRLTIDGVVYAEITSTTSSQQNDWYLAIAHIALSNNPYLFNNSVNEGQLFSIAFKTSVLIEAYANTATAGNRKVNYIITKKL